MMPAIVAIAEVVEGIVRPVTREVCATAQAIADATGLDWGVVVMGPSIDGLEDVPTIIRVRPDSLADSGPAIRSATLAEVCKNCDVILMMHTAGGSDLMGRMAQHLDVPLPSDCVGLELKNDQIKFTRALYGGKVLSTVRVTSSPIMATFRPRTFSALPKQTSRATAIEIYVDPIASQSSVSMVAEAVKDRLDVTEADLVVSGGRGMQDPENWRMLEDLVTALGPRATLACSRPVSDNGWRPRSEHVGQTGRAIAPDLYIACGISGAVQHVAGIARSKCIVAINKDPDAPIFQVADYGIVGDLFEVVPALTAAIRQLQ